MRAFVQARKSASAELGHRRPWPDAPPAELVLALAAAIAPAAIGLVQRFDDGNSVRVLLRDGAQKFLIAGQLMTLI